MTSQDFYSYNGDINILINIKNVKICIQLKFVSKDNLTFTSVWLHVDGHGENKSLWKSFRRSACYSNKFVMKSYGTATQFDVKFSVIVW